MLSKAFFALLVTALAVSASPLEARQQCSQSYTVASGDTCAVIEAKNGISDSQLHALNPSINSGCTNLQIGQILCLAGGSSGGGGGGSGGGSSGGCPETSSQMVVYWGQNSYGVTHPGDPANWQKTISDYCQDTVIDVIPIAFVNQFFSTGGLPQLDLSNICSTAGSVFPGTNLANCQFLAAGIQACQAKGKKVTISLGGQTSSTLSSDAEGTAFATTIWNLFLGGSSSTRPFGTAVLDGVDLDIENGDATGYAAFVNQIRALSAGASKHYIVTAAPQCVFPDAHIGSALNMASFDAVYVQFYNNFCGVSTPATFNFATWDNWAKTSSPNPNVKVFIGAPASSSAGGGFVDAATLGALAVQTRAQFSSFGGVMLWDASQAFANGRFDMQVKNILNSCSGGGGGGGSGGGGSGGGGSGSGGGGSSGCAKSHTVVSGDTCATIESQNGVSDAQLHALNPGINSGCTNLQIGQSLCLAAGTGGGGGGGGCAKSHTVVSGDTCATIESQNGVTDAQLHALNPGINSGCTNLQIGQILCLA